MAFSFLATACATAREFSPTSIMAVPITVSLPSRVAAPVRSSLPMATSATSATRTGAPSRLAITTCSISPMVASCPGERTNSCWPLRSI